ncbi:ABC transporter ATP-binding protein [Aliikangiella sp. G2MR2-5]|uniref:ABC transporter ATP-binding protein n=1 Tax=Aliikangiella sp. G2MR2-5 TaxID=2788943 RepID=UPI0018AB50A6|nr:ABC transporter ATP-binding protein [Aliikangiella sp. G2MR2-5]
MNSPIISINSLTKAYGQQHVLNQLNWQVEQGDIVALLGKNGAGKSTLLETLMGLRDASSGEIRIWDSHWNDMQQERREKVAFVAQDIKGFEWMNVKTFLEYLGGFFPQWDRDYCFQLSSRWNLDPKKRVGDLSGGQSQILHVIQALSSKPELLILDEPVAHLDPGMRREFLAELIELSCDLNSTVIFSSHIVSDLERVANKVALLAHGEINHYYDVDTLKSSIAHVKLTGDSRVDKLPYFDALHNWHSRHDGATASIVSPLEKPIESMAEAAGVQVEKLPMSLEDWYLEVSHATN